VLEVGRTKEERAVKRALVEIAVAAVAATGLCLWCCHDLLPWDLSEVLASTRAAPRPEYQVRYLDWGQVSTPMDINERGRAVGVTLADGRNLSPAISDARFQLISGLCSGRNVREISINNAEQAAITVDSSPMRVDERRVYLVTPEGAELCPLDPDRDGRCFISHAIGDTGLIVGALLKETVHGRCRAVAYSVDSGFVELDGGPSCAIDINGHDQIVGFAGLGRHEVARLWERDSGGNWSAQDITEPSALTTRAVAISDTGVVVGWSGNRWPFVWDREAGL